MLQAKKLTEVRAEAHAELGMVPPPAMATLPAMPLLQMALAGQPVPELELFPAFKGSGVLLSGIQCIEISCWLRAAMLCACQRCLAGSAGQEYACDHVEEQACTAARPWSSQASSAVRYSCKGGLRMQRAGWETLAGKGKQLANGNGNADSESALLGDYIAPDLFVPSKPEPVATAAEVVEARWELFASGCMAHLCSVVNSLLQRGGPAPDWGSSYVAIVGAGTCR